MTTSGSPQQGVKSALRTLDLIEFVVAHPSGVGAQEIASALSIPVSSLSYLLATLTEREYLRRDGRRYLAGIGLDRLKRPRHEYSLSERAAPLLKALVAQLNETASIFEPIGWELEAVLTETSTQTLRYALEVGKRVPLHCVSAGKAYLAALPESELAWYFQEAERGCYSDRTIVGKQALTKEIGRVRTAGYASAHDEFTLGITAIGAAIIGNGKPVGAISIVCPNPRATAELKARMIEHVVKAAAALSDG